MIRLLEIETESFKKDIISNNDGYNDPFFEIKQIKHPIYGECLIYKSSNQIKYLLNKD